MNIRVCNIYELEMTYLGILDTPVYYHFFYFNFTSLLIFEIRICCLIFSIITSSVSLFHLLFFLFAYPQIDWRGERKSMMKFGQIKSQNFQVMNREFNDVGSTV